MTKRVVQSCDKIIKVGLRVLFFFSPLIFWLSARHLFTLTKETFFHLLILIIVAAWLIKMIQTGELKFVRTPLDLPIVAFILMAEVSLLNSPSIQVSLRDLYRIIAVALLYFVLVNNIRTRRDVDVLLTAILITCGLVALNGALQDRGIAVFPGAVVEDWRGKIVATIGNPNFLSGYLAGGLLIAVAMLLTDLTKLKRLLVLFATVLMLVCLVVAFSLGAWLGLLIAIIFGCIYLTRLKPGKISLSSRKSLYFLVGIFILTLLFYFTPNPFNGRPTTILAQALSSQDWRGGVDQRFLIWHCTTNMIKDHPILGSGIGSFKFRYLNYQYRFLGNGRHSFYVPFACRADRAHNEYLQVWAEMGILGLGILIWLLVTFYRNGLRMIRALNDRDEKLLMVGFLAGTVAVLGHSLVSFPFHIVPNNLFFCLLMALTMAGRENIYSHEDSAAGMSRSRVLTLSVKKKGIRIAGQIIIISITAILAAAIIKPFLADIHFKKALQYTEKAQVDEVISECKQALTLDPSNGEVRLCLGNAYLNQGKYSEAIRELLESLKTGEDPNIYFNLGLAYSKMGMFNKAVIAYKVVIGMIPNYVDASSNLADIYSSIGRYDEAIAAYERVIALEPDRAAAYNNLGIVYIMEGRKREAIVQWEKALQLNPDFEDAKKNLKRVRFEEQGEKL